MDLNNQHAGETAARWGDTDAYKISKSRTSNYTEADWAIQQTEQQAAVDQFIQAKTSGLPADSELACEAAEAHRLVIDKWFYPCNYEMQSNLAAMYIADERFSKYYNDLAAGLAQYVHDAILANALKHL